MPFNFLKGLAGNVQERISEIKDAGEFEAAIAACALVGGSDGDWDEDEVNETIDAMTGHTAFTAFKGQVSGKVAEYEPLATKHGGRRQLLDKCRKAAGGANGASIFFVAVDVAEATGGIDESEAKMLAKVADALGVSGDPDIRELLAEI